MPRPAPYLQRRGYGLTFRISVPPDLRQALGQRELTKTLQTAQKDTAIPLALEYAASAKRLFSELRARVTEANSSDNGGVKPVMDMQKLRLQMKDGKHKIEIQELEERHEEAMTLMLKEHQQKLRIATLEAEKKAYRSVLTGLQGVLLPMLSARV
jgi:hypothetical protein